MSRSLRLSFAVAIAGLLAAVPACGSKNTGKLRIAVVTNCTDPFWDLCEAGAKKAAADHDVELLFRQPERMASEVQKPIIDSFVSQGVSGIAVSVIDPKGQTDNFAYSALGQPTSESFPATAATPAETVSYSYGANGRTESVTDNRGTTSLVYETGNDRVSRITDSVTGQMSYTYLPDGERAAMTLPGGGTWTST